MSVAWRASVGGVVRLPSKSPLSFLFFFRWWRVGVIDGVLLTSKSQKNSRQQVLITLTTLYGKTTNGRGHYHDGSLDYDARCTRARRQESATSTTNTNKQMRMK